MMSAETSADGAALADQGAEIVLSPPELLCRGFKSYERYSFKLLDEDAGVTHTRDVLRYGAVVAVLPVDLTRGKVVLLRQFRLAAHLATGRGNLVEIVAGFVDKDETAPRAAQRECLEEIGVRPQRLIELFTFLSSPGTSDEQITLFLAMVDSSRVPERAGAPGEGESTRPMVLPIETAITALATHQVRNGPLILALQWLALNHSRLHDIVRLAPAAV
jgi:ADP-ribose pyrophosphatase